MTDSLSALLIATLGGFALVALVAAIALIIARARTRERAPLAGALTFALLALAAAAGAAVIADALRSTVLVAAAVVPLIAVAAISIARIGLLRGEHQALIGGSAAVRDARSGGRSALRAVVATTRLAERLDAVATGRDVDEHVLAAARHALPDATVTIGLAAHAPTGLRAAVPYPGERALTAMYDRAPRGGRTELSAATVVLRALAAEAALGLQGLAARIEREALGRRSSVQRTLDQRLETASDASGAAGLAAQAAVDLAGAPWAEVRGPDGTVLASRGESGPGPGEGRTRELARGKGSLVAGAGAPDDPLLNAALDGVADSLAPVLEAIEMRAVAERSRSRQSAMAAAAAAARGPAESMVQAIVTAARSGFAADAVILYTLEGERPTPVAAVGVDPPEACDGVAAQAVAATRAVLDLDGAFLAASAIPGLVNGLAAPLPGNGRGVMSVLFRERAALDEGDLADLDAFVQLAALALDRATMERELDRREQIRSGFVDIAESLAGPREPSETYAVVAGAARRVLRASGAVVVAGDDGLVAAGSAPLPPALVDDAGNAGALLRLAAQEGRLVLCADTRNDRRVPAAERRRLIEAGVHAALCVPIGASQGAGAVLGVVWAEAHVASEDELELARHLAAAAGAAIERAETLASERQARARAQELQRIGGLMASNLDAPAVLREIVSQAALLLNADSCALRLVEGDRLVVRAVQGAAAEVLAGEQTTLGGGPTGEVLARRTPVAVADMAADDRFLPDDPLVQARFSAYLGAPILSPDGDLRGVLALYDRRRRAWKPDEIEALGAFANSATVALQNALLYQRVAQEKEKSEAIIASIADGIVVVDTDGRIEMWNRAAATMTGVSSRNALRRTLRDVLKGELGDHDGGGLVLLQDALTGGSAVELRLARGDREIYLSARAAQLRDPIEDRVGTVYALRDVSQERQLDQLKSDFVATVSHELRTPLTSIYGFAETLLRSDVSFAEDDKRTFLGYIASESERLTRLVDGLLSVTRLEAGGVELDLADVDVGEVLREVVVRQAERAKDTHRVELQLPAGALVAAADRDKLRQIVLNLVDNAIKYSPNGGTILVAARRQLDAVEIQVSDEGIGISAADQRNLFRKFFRADARMTRGIRGIGLGLYLTRGFITAMGGRIRVESEAGKGSTFIVDLPLRRGAGGGVRAA